MKNSVLKLLFIFALLILIGEECSIFTIILKIISLLYIMIVAKANNYFYQGGDNNVKRWRKRSDRMAKKISET